MSGSPKTPKKLFYPESQTPMLSFTHINTKCIHFLTLKKAGIFANLLNYFMLSSHSLWKVSSFSSLFREDLPGR